MGNAQYSFLNQAKGSRQMPYALFSKLKRSASNQPGAGFSLIEMMVVIAILGLLMAIILPGYQESQRKSQRSDAQIMLTRLATLQERFFFRTNQYTGDFANLVTGVASGYHYHQ
jgi:type IV pilus assembly protein PilE